VTVLPPPESSLDSSTPPPPEAELIDTSPSSLSLKVEQPSKNEDEEEDGLMDVLPDSDEVVPAVQLARHFILPELIDCPLSIPTFE